MSLETVYREHHATSREPFSAVELGARGEFLRRRIGINKRVLDIGCRDGALTATYCQGNDVLGIDIDAYALRSAGQTLEIQTKHADLNEPWDIAEASFDVVVAGEVLEHLYNPRAVIRRIRAVLKPGGRLVGSVPHAFCLQNRVRLLFGTKKHTPLMDPTHINQFFHRELQSMLECEFSRVEVLGLSSGRYSWLPQSLRRYFSQLLLFDAERS